MGIYLCRQFNRIRRFSREGGFEQYKAQAAFLDRNKIDTREQLQAKIAELNGTIETLTKSRIIWNSKKKRRRDLYSALSTIEHLADVPDLYTQGVAGIEEDYKRRQGNLVLNLCKFIKPEYYERKSGGTRP